MGGALRCRRGGIVGLLLLPRPQWQAIEVDLLPLGLGWDDVGERLSWRVLVAFVRHSPRTSALMRARYGARVAWSDAEQLLAILVDLQSTALWFKTEDGHKGRKRPKPIPRPTDTPGGTAEGKSLGGKGIAREHFAARWAELTAAGGADGAG